MMSPTDPPMQPERGNASAQVLPLEEPTIPGMLDEAFPWERKQTEPFQFEPGVIGVPVREARIVVTPAAMRRTEENVRHAAERLPRSVRDAFLGGAGLIGGEVAEDDDSGLDGLFE